MNRKLSAEPKMPVLPNPDKRRPRASRRLLGGIVLFFVILFAVLFFQSSISKIGRIDIAGAVVTDPAEIERASGLAVGDHFFGFWSKTVEQRIARLPAVERADVTKRFPGYVRIEVREFPRVAYEYAADGRLMALLANGHAIPAHDPAGSPDAAAGGAASEGANSAGKAAPLAPDRPILSGWTADAPLKRELCAQLARIPDELLLDLSEIHPAPKEFFEDRIKIYTRSHYEVYARVGNLPEKIELLDNMIHERVRIEQSQGKRIPGYFTIIDQLYFTPYEEASAEEKKQTAASP